MLRKVSLLLIAMLFQFAFAQDSGLSDGEIANVLLAVNESEIDAAKLADGKAQNANVRSFAKMLVSEHKENMKTTKRVAKEIGVSAKDSNISKMFEEEGELVYKELKRAEKGSFDHVFLDQQIVMHDKILSTLNNTLIPGAQDLKLKAQLERSRDSVAAHLAQARSLRSSL